MWVAHIRIMWNSWRRDKNRREAEWRRGREREWKDGLSRVICREQQAHTAESCGPQTPYRKPKQLSIIQQVQSEPATEEKTWEERRFEGRGGIEERYLAWELDTKDLILIFCQCVQKHAMRCVTFRLMHQQQLQIMRLKDLCQLVDINSFSLKEWFNIFGNMLHCFLSENEMKISIWLNRTSSCTRWIKISKAH